MEKDGPYREDPKELRKAEWEKHPVYLADMSALFGGRPNLKCQYCGGADYELFYGHCQKCAETKGVPKRTAKPQEFHDALNRGTSTVIKGIPEGFSAQKKKYHWWHWRRWFSSKNAG